MKGEESRGKKGVQNRCVPQGRVIPVRGGSLPVMTGSGAGEMEGRPALLLHSCCGPCSTSVIETLAEEFDVTVYYYNPCITEEEEYIRRRDTQRGFIEEYNRRNESKTPIRLIEGEYRPGTFLAMVEGLEEEPEGGKRCLLCFRQRLEKTAETAKLLGFDYFTTTLTVSPHKNYRTISEIGRRIAVTYGVSFLDRDFKKKDGFARSIRMSKSYGLYRQDYCGCRFSIRKQEDESE